MNKSQANGRNQQRGRNMASGTSSGAEISTGRRSVVGMGFGSGPEVGVASGSRSVVRKRNH